MLQSIIPDMPGPNVPARRRDCIGNGSRLREIPELADPRLEAFGKDTLKHGAAYGYSPDTAVRHLVPGPLGTRLA